MTRLANEHIDLPKHWDTANMAYSTENALEILSEYYPNWRLFKDVYFHANILHAVVENDESKVLEYRAYGETAAIALCRVFLMAKFDLRWEVKK